MRRSILATAVALYMMLAATPALAGSKWCVIDPVITVDGRTSDVSVQFDDTYTPTLTTPVSFRVHVPANSTVSVGYPVAPVAYAVAVSYDLPARAKRDPITVTVDTLVSATATFATQTVVSLSRGTVFAAYGVSGSITTVSYSLR